MYRLDYFLKDDYRRVLSIGIDEIYIKKVFAKKTLYECVKDERVSTFDNIESVKSFYIENMLNYKKRY